MLFDRTLIDPGGRELAAALKAALEAVAADLDYPGEPPDWRDAGRAILAEVRATRAGVNGRSQGRLSFRINWATDHLGKKLVRVEGGGDELFAPRLRVNQREEPWPPLALILREQVLLYQPNVVARPEVLLACACGVMGRPGEIAWRDGRCGPCHDRLTEGVALPEPLYRHGRNLSHDGGLPVALTPDGQRAVVTSARLVNVGTRRTWRKLPGSNRLDGATFSGDGTRLAYLCAQPSGSRVHVVTYPDLASVISAEVPGQARAVTLSLDGSVAYVNTWDDPVYLVEAGKPPRLIANAAACALAVSPDDRWVAAVSREGAVVLLSRQGDTQTQLAPLPTPQYGVGFTPDGAALMVLGLAGVTFLAVPSGHLLGTFLTPIYYAVHCARVGPWLVAFQHWATTETQFLPWSPLVDFVRRASTG